MVTWPANFLDLVRDPCLYPSPSWSREKLSKKGNSLLRASTTLKNILTAAKNSPIHFKMAEGRIEKPETHQARHSQNHEILPPNNNRKKAKSGRDCGVPEMIDI